MGGWAEVGGGAVVAVASAAGAAPATLVCWCGVPFFGGVRCIITGLGPMIIISGFFLALGLGGGGGTVGVGGGVVTKISSIELKLL